MKGTVHCLWAMLMVSLMPAGQQAYGQAGQSGMAFLKLGVSARSVSMGDAMSAHAGGAVATYYNPAGILGRESGSTQFLLMHREWIQDIRSQFLGVSVQLDEENALGFSANTATVSDIQVRTRPGTPQGTFTSRDFAVSATYARSVSDALQIGITAKFLFEKIFVDDANGFAFDLGAQYRTPLENFRVGLSLANLGSMNALRSEKITLPSLLRFGPAYTLDLDDFSARLTVASDLLYIFPEKKSSVNLGAELLFNQVVAARAGFQAGSSARGFTTGFGVHHDMFGIDYAFSLVSEDLGSAHTFSLTVTF